MYICICIYIYIYVEGRMMVQPSRRPPMPSTKNSILNKLFSNSVKIKNDNHYVGISSTSAVKQLTVNSFEVS